MIEKCAVWRDLGEEEKLLSFALSPSVYMEINFNSILGTELIPSSHYRVDTDAIFFSHFVRIKISSHERQIWLKKTPSDLDDEYQRGSAGVFVFVCWGDTEKGSELHSGSVPDMFLPFYSPDETLYLLAWLQEALLSSNNHRYEGDWMKWGEKNNFQILSSHAKLSSVSKIVLLFFY